MSAKADTRVVLGVLRGGLRRVNSHAYGSLYTAESSILIHEAAWTIQVYTKPWELQAFVNSGSGVICATRMLRATVIPAKAGIHTPGLWKCAVEGLDSRLRGNDRDVESDNMTNDATT
jgi:hypothetical protein